ncbi:MAG TPA: hypothetical protein VNA19_08120 [Pyrinomonadaceae bacterium]|jgi:dipeptidyl aminopeptidase/acylaminoacyl peptidase|nr:hypothetical protein [Pyrinomonadaceae bacterium]
MKITIARTLARIVAAVFICSIAVNGQTPTPTPAPSTQAPPATDIFLVSLQKRGGRWQAGQPLNITRRAGYDNQPSFLPDGRTLLYTSIREDKQADIYRYDYRAASETRLTATAESEYSPTLTPDGRYFSVIRVEADSTQRLWKFPLRGGGTPAPVLEKIKPVGYHLWLDARTLALFILGEPNTLQVVETGTEKASVVLENIGRSLQRIPQRQAMSVVHKIGEKEWMIKSLDFKTRRLTTVTKTLDGSEDLTWTPDGALLMAQESKLFIMYPAREAIWRELADFSAARLKNITRLAISPKGDRLALVAVPEK